MSWNGLQTGNYFHRNLAIWHHSFNSVFLFLIQLFWFLLSGSWAQFPWWEYIDCWITFNCSKTAKLKFTNKFQQEENNHYCTVEVIIFGTENLTNLIDKSCFWKLLRRLRIPSLYQVWRHSRDWLVHSCQLSLDLSWAMTCIILNKID